MSTSSSRTMCAKQFRPNFDESLTTMVRCAEEIICAIICASCRLVVVRPVLAETPPTPMTATSALMPSVPGNATGPMVTCEVSRQLPPSR
jgi:hypothetical protein